MALKNRRAAWLSSAIILLRVIPACADGATDRVAAEALFDEGRRLLAAGNFAAACPKLEASNRLDPAIGTLLNLGDCYEKNGQTASGWATFREAAAAAHRMGDASREAAARARAARLEGTLSHLTVAVSGASAPQLAVVRDGQPIDRAILGTATPIDPGRHVIEASAPGKKTWTKTVDIGKDGQSVQVTVPYLENDPGAASLAENSAPAGAAAPRGASGESDMGSVRLHRTGGLIVGGVGAAAVIVGSVFGLSATSKWNEAKSNCPEGFCDDERWINQRNDARSAATVSTVLFAVGGAALAGGVVLWLTAPASRTPAVGISPHGIVIGGAL